MNTELRFIKRTVPAPEYGENIGKREKILQYRTSFALIGTPSIGWSKWKDVPRSIEFHIQYSLALLPNILHFLHQHMICIGFEVHLNCGCAYET